MRVQVHLPCLRRLRRGGSCRGCTGLLCVHCCVVCCVLGVAGARVRVLAAVELLLILSRMRAPGVTLGALWLLLLLPVVVLLLVAVLCVHCCAPCRRLAVVDAQVRGRGIAAVIVIIVTRPRAEDLTGPWLLQLLLAVVAWLALLGALLLVQALVAALKR
jgi:hypothetical protein